MKRTSPNSARAKRKSILLRIASLEQEVARAREFLDKGEHAHWHGFHAMFFPKGEMGKEPPPHRDWVKNFFLPRAERGLHRSQKALERLDRHEAS